MYFAFFCHARFKTVPRCYNPRDLVIRFFDKLLDVFLCRLAIGATSLFDRHPTRLEWAHPDSGNFGESVWISPLAIKRMSFA
jgi:hypothetical protein